MTIELILAEDLPEIAKSGDKIILKDDGQFEITKADGTIIQKPFAGYKDFSACTQQNKDKENPEAYCGSIKHRVEDTKKSDEVEKVKDVRSTEEKPTEVWWDECTKRVKEGNPGYTKEQVDSTCGKMHYHSTGMGTKKEYDPRIEKYLSIDKEKSWQILEKFYKNGHLDSYKVLKEVLNKVATCPDVTEKFEKIMDGWMKEGEADIGAVEKIINSCKDEGGNRIIEGEPKKVTKSESIVKEILNLQ